MNSFFLSRWSGPGPVLRGIGLALCLLPTAVSAQEATARKHLTLTGIASGTVAPHGMAFISLALTNRRVGAPIRDNDGSLALGFGLGSAEDNIGVQVTASITSLSRPFGDAGSFSLKASRRLSAGRWHTYLGVSADYLAPWGQMRGQKASVTAALTGFTSVRLGSGYHPVMVTVGGGSRIRNNDTDPGLFAGVGLGLTTNLAASAAWTGDGLDLGLGATVPGLPGLDLSLSANDVTNRRNSRRLTLTATWALRDAFGR